MKIHQRRADGKATSKPTDRLNRGLPGRWWIVSSQLSGSRQVVPCRDPTLFRPEVPRRWAPGFRFPPPPPACPPRCTQPGGATHVLLHFSQVLLREGQGGSLHGRGREGVLPARATPPRLRARGSGSQAMTTGALGTDAGERPAHGHGGGDLNAPLPAPPLGLAVPRSASFLTQAPPFGEAGLSAGPSHLRASQSVLALGYVPASAVAPPTAGVPLTTPLHLHRVEDWPPEKDLFPWAEHWLLSLAGSPRLRRLLVWVECGLS